MMNRARGPLWHKKYKDQGIIPKGLRGVDREATWCKSGSDGWIYGHGSFSICSHKIPVLGRFIYMRNSKNEAKKLWHETYHHKNITDYVVMDSKADDSDLFREMKRQRNILLITRCRKNMNKSPERRKMIEIMEQPAHKALFGQRGFTVEPVQGLVKDIFDLDNCLMRGEKNNRWLFAAMGVAVQIAQLAAYRKNRSTWRIKDDVLGI